MAGLKVISAALTGVLASAVVAFAGEVTKTAIHAGEGSAASQPGEHDDAPAAGRVGTTSSPTPFHHRAPDSQPDVWSGCSDLAAEAGGGASPAGKGAIDLPIDPSVFFQRLVHRYKGLHLYRDSVRLVQVTMREGAEAARVETEIGCEIHDNNLHVKTPASQARSSVGLDLPVRHSPAAAAAQRGYDLWIAPHMTLKFDDEPLKHFRAGVDEGFTPTGAESITIDNHTLVHVQLRSGDGLSESCNATFDLFVNPQTMLVERIDGEQKMPDGGSCTTSLRITPQEAEGGETTLQ